jgi:hypothetical protein
VLKSETAQLLMWAQGVDNRTITEATVAVWHDAVGEYEFDDAIHALRAHIREVPRMVYPADIVKRLAGDPNSWMYPDITAEMLREQRDEWLAVNGLTLEEFEANRHDPAWVSRVKATAEIRNTDYSDEDEQA